MYKPQFKGKPEDRTNDDGVHITFNLTDTGYEEINKSYGNETFDCVEDFMNLKTSLDSNINMISVDGSVAEYKKYEHVIDTWFPYRKQLYSDRIDRHIILTNLMILYLKNIIRFTQNHQKYNITPKTKLEKLNEILTKNNYDRFNSTLLHSPKYTDVCELEKLIMQSSSDFINMMKIMTKGNKTKENDTEKKNKTKENDTEKKNKTKENDTEKKNKTKENDTEKKNKTKENDTEKKNKTKSKKNIAKSLHHPNDDPDGDSKSQYIQNRNLLNSNINYEYLIKLSYRDMIECACIKRKKLLDEYENKLKHLLLDVDESEGNFKGKKTWLSEIDELENVIKLGMKLGWSYGKDVAKFR